MAGVDVKKMLPLHVTWIVGLVIAWISWRVAGDTRLGVDSHAYWAAWRGSWSTDMYDIAPGRLDAYNYSPAFAQLIWPLTQMPWPLFGFLWSATATAALVYLLRPLGWRWVAPLMLCASPELLSGNIFWLLALTTVWGLRPRSPKSSLWSVAALTKVTVTLGPIWFAVRREWASLGVVVITTGALVGLSYATNPELWHQWLDFLLTHEASTQQSGSTILPPLIVRLPLAVLVTCWGALTSRRWAVPIAMVLATPVAGPAAFTMLAAIPRLRGHGHHLGVS